MSTFSGAQLASALHSLGVDFVLNREDAASPLKNDPSLLIAALAESDESRLRLSLIPLFMQHPEFAKNVGEVVKTMPPSPRVTLECFYTAAVWLQQKYSERLAMLLGEKNKLPDLFSTELGLARRQDPEENLQDLAERHQQLSGKYINWLGTYEHGAQRFMIHLEHLKQWQPESTNKSWPFSKV